MRESSGAAKRGESTRTLPPGRTTSQLVAPKDDSAAYPQSYTPSAPGSGAGKDRAARAAAAACFSEVPMAATGQATSAMSARSSSAPGRGWRATKEVSSSPPP